MNKKTLLSSLILTQMFFWVVFFWYPGFSLPSMHSRQFGANCTDNQRLATPAENPGSLVPTDYMYWGSLHCKEEDFELYVYSAFYDDRDLVDEMGPAVVRVFGSSLFPELHNVTLECIVKYPGDPNQDIVPVDTTFNTGRLYGGFRSYIYICPLKRPNAVPELVSLVCSPVAKPQFYLPVQVAERPPRKREFAICVCASYRSRDVYQVIEWMELQQLLGVSKITVYNHSITDETSRIFLHYAEEGLVDFRQTRPFMDRTKSPFDQSKPHKTPTINDCVYRNMYSFNHILIIDFDELIVPRIHANLSEMLSAIDAENQLPARSYVFRNDFFPLELAPDPNVSSKLITQSYRTRLGPSLPGQFVKSVVDPTACTCMEHHRCSTWTAKHRLSPSSVDVNTTVGMNHHYRRYCKTGGPSCPKQVNHQLEHFQDDTMLRFREQLIPRVQKQLEKLGLGPL